MRFVDRKKEIERIQKRLHDEKRCFVVIYGRRRLGKSTMIRQILGENDIYYMAEKNEMTMQLALMQQSIATVYPSFSGMVFDSWESLLLNFNEICESNSTVVLDEFPYLVRSCASLPSTLQKIIDSKRLKYNLIICGSSQRMMQKIVLDASEPLYGRADERINLQPIPIRYWKDELGLSATQAIEEYSVWGGVPRYWELREKEDSFEEAVDRLVFDHNGILYDEPSALFLDEEGNGSLFTSIMNALGSGHCQYSRLANAVGKKTTELSTPLKQLSEMSFISKEVPFNESELKSKKTVYHIDDPFMDFYYHFVSPYKSLLAIGRTNYVERVMAEQFNTYVGTHWERLCRLAVSGSTMEGHTWMMARRWWGTVLNERSEQEQIELDVLAESMDKKYLLVGECKWQKADYAGRLYAEPKRKAELLPFAKGHKIVYMLFLKHKPLDDVKVAIKYPDDIIDFCD